MSDVTVFPTGGGRWKSVMFKDGKWVRALGRSPKEAIENVGANIEVTIEACYCGDNNAVQGLSRQGSGKLTWYCVDHAPKGVWS